MADEPKLIDQALEYREAFEKLADSELPDQAITDTLEGLAGPIEKRTEALAAFAERLDIEADAYIKRGKLIQDRGTSRKKRAERIRHYILAVMKAGGMKVIETMDFKIQVKKSGWKCIVDAPTQVTPEYMRYPDPPAPEIDKAKILSDLAAGKELPFAHREQGEYLEVK